MHFALAWTVRRNTSYVGQMHWRTEFCSGTHETCASHKMSEIMALDTQSTESNCSAHAHGLKPTYNIINF